MRRAIVILLLLTLMLSLASAEETPVYICVPKADKSGLEWAQPQEPEINGESTELYFLHSALAQIPGCRLSSYQKCSDIVFADVETCFVTDDTDRALITFSLWQTLSYNTNAEALNLKINGVCAQADGQLIVTLFCTQSELSLESLWQCAINNRKSVIYYPSANGLYAVPIVSEYCDAPGKLAQKIADNPEGLVSVIVELKDKPAFDKEGRRLLQLSADRQQAAAEAAVVLTFCDNSLNTQGVCFVSEAAEAFYAYPRNYRNQRASLLKTYEDSLPVILPAGDSENACALVTAVCAKYLSANDVLSAHMENEVLKVDLSAAFYERCQTMSEQSERECVFEMVNAMCEATGARSVIILIEGRTAQTLAGSVSINGELFTDYGR